MNIKQSQDSDQQRKQLANRIGEKIEKINKQIIFPGKEIDIELGKDLAGIYLALEKYRDSIDKLLAFDVQNREKMEEALVGTDSALNHIESHIKNAHRLFEVTKTYYCWK